MNQHLDLDRRLEVDILLTDCVNRSIEMEYPPERTPKLWIPNVREYEDTDPEIVELYLPAVNPDVCL